MVRTKTRLEQLVKDAHDKLKKYLLDGENDEGGTNHKIISTEAHPALDASANISIVDHAVTLLEKLVELIRSFEDQNIRRDHARALLLDISKPVGYFTHNILQHLSDITHSEDEQQEITLLQRDITQLTEYVGGLEGTGSLNPIIPKTKEETSAAPTPAPTVTPTSVAVPTATRPAPTAALTPGFWKMM
jgi:hypothetical protein